MLAGLLIAAMSMGAVSLGVSLTLSLPIWMALVAYAASGMILLGLGAPLLAMIGAQGRPKLDCKLG